MRAPRAAALAALLLVVSACGSDADTDTDTDAGSGSSTSSGSVSGPSADETAGASAPVGGTAAEPATARPRTDLLDWEPVEGSVEDVVTTGGGWTLRVSRGETQASLQGPQPTTIPAGKGRRISEALLDDRYAVVVAQDKLEERAAVATVIELDTGRRTVLDDRSPHPTVNGGTWALGPGATGGSTLAHATYGADGSYCLARVDLGSGESESAWCAPQRHGFNNAQITPAGTSLLTFDDSRPSCFTVLELSGQEATPFPDVTDCKGWDGLLLEDGAVWSVVPKANQIESAHFYARNEQGHFDLGAGTSGSLTRCAGAAYFAQDPQRDGDPARLMRWDGTDLSVVYETPGEPGLVGEPRCGGDRLTLSALSEGGDEQVSAPVG